MARLPKHSERFLLRIRPMELRRWRRWARITDQKVSEMVRRAVQDFGARAEKKAG